MCEVLSSVPISEKERRERGREISLITLPKNEMQFFCCPILGETIFFSLCSGEDGTEGLGHARQVLYHCTSSSLGKPI
jgi:hypothetical protein